MFVHAEKIVYSLFSKNGEAQSKLRQALILVWSLSGRRARDGCYHNIWVSFYDGTIKALTAHIIDWLVMWLNLHFSHLILLNQVTNDWKTLHFYSIYSSIIWAVNVCICRKNCVHILSKNGEAELKLRQDLILVWSLSGSRASDFP